MILAVSIFYVTQAVLLYYVPLWRRRKSCRIPKKIWVADGRDYRERESGKVGKSLKGLETACSIAAIALMYPAERSRFQITPSLFQRGVPQRSTGSKEQIDVGHRQLLRFVPPYTTTLSLVELGWLGSGS